MNSFFNTLLPCLVIYISGAQRHCCDIAQLNMPTRSSLLVSVFGLIVFLSFGFTSKKHFRIHLFSLFPR